MFVWTRSSCRLLSQHTMAVDHGHRLSPIANGQNVTSTSAMCSLVRVWRDTDVLLDTRGLKRLLEQALPSVSQIDVYIGYIANTGMISNLYSTTRWNISPPTVLNWVAVVRSDTILKSRNSHQSPTHSMF